MAFNPKLVANFVLFQLGWLVSVVGASRGYPLAGIVYAVAWASLHHWYLRRGRLHELVFVFGSAALGFLVDSLLVRSGFVGFPEQARFGSPTTVWMVCLWLMFAMTLRHSLAWLRPRFILAAILGAVFGPLAYWTGSRIGAIQIQGDVAGLAAIAIAWSASMIGLLQIERLTRMPIQDATVRGVQ